MRGHRLVADDIVEVRERTPDTIYRLGHPRSSSTTWRSAASASSTSRTCSASPRCATRRRSSWSSSCVEWDEDEEYDRLGLDEMVYPILEVEVPLLRIPVRPGRNISSIIEVAARNQLLKFQGHHSAREFQERLNRALAEARDAAHAGGTRSSERTCQRSSSSPACPAPEVDGAARARGPRLLLRRQPAAAARAAVRRAARRRGPRSSSAALVIDAREGEFLPATPRGASPTLRDAGHSARGAVPRRRRRRPGAPLLRDAPAPPAVRRRPPRRHRARARAAAPAARGGRRAWSTPATSTCTSCKGVIQERYGARPTATGR